MAKRSRKQRSRSTERTPPGSPGPRRRRRYLLLLLVLPALLVVPVLLANPCLPAAPELQAVRLEPAVPPAPARPLLELLRSKPPAYSILPPPLEQAAGTAFREGRWPQNLEQIEKELAALNPPLPQVERALLAPGCLPRDADWRGADELSFLPLLRGARLLALASVVHSARGRPEQGARSALAALDRLLAVERQCAPDLLAVTVLGVALQQLATALGFALAEPSLPGAAEAEIWRRLIALEQRPSPIPDALRWEARGVRELARRDFDEPPGKQKQPGPRARDELPSWPYYDRGATLALGDRLARRNIWVAGQPIDERVWTRPDPEREQLDRLMKQPRPLHWLRYNAAGMVLMSLAPDLRSYSLKWHRDRCLAAARRARWMQDLRARGRAPHPEAARQPPQDPFRKQPFTGLESRAVCGLPREVRAAEALKVGSDPLPLPPPPSQPAASQPDAAP